MTMKVTCPIYEEIEVNKVVEDIKRLWDVCKLVKTYYPSTWMAMKAQYFPDYSDKKLSDSLFEKKIEIMLLQDEEKRS